MKANQLRLEKDGLHPEVYISNTNRGVIIIYTEASNKALKELNKFLEINPNVFETTTRQDTLVMPSANKKNQAFDFCKASLISQDYKNAFNYKVDPLTGVSWSKISKQKYRLKEDMFGEVLYDLIFVISNHK